MNADQDAEIIVGTYEDYVVAYQLETRGKKFNKKVKSSSDEEISKIDRMISRSSEIFLDQSFAVRGHSGSVKCLANSPNGTLLFSVGQDEMMNLFSLKKRKLLYTTKGAATCANFVGSSHLICGSEDGNIYIYECNSAGMKMVKTLRGHKAGVSAIDTHLSGKVLLSLSRDKTMRTWNLIKGRSAYVTHIGIEAHLVKWVKGNDGFIIAANKDIYLYNKLGSLKQRLSLDKRVNSIEFVEDNMFAVATDSGKLDLFHIKEEEFKLLLSYDAHEARIKSIKCLLAHNDLTDEGSDSTLKSAGMNQIQIATASSDGSVKVWSIERVRDTLMKSHELARVDVGARITCMVATQRNGSN